MTEDPGIGRRLGAGAGWLWRQGRSRLRLPRGQFWVRLRLGSPIPEAPMPGLFRADPGLSYVDVLRVLGATATDPRVAGVLVRFNGPPGGLARTAGLRRSLLALRSAGKPIVAFSERYSSADLSAASGASHVLLPESGSVFLTGLRLEGLYLRELMDRLGVRADVVRAGDFKAAGEMLTRSAPSEENRAQLGAIADDLFAELCSGLAEGRGLSEAVVSQLIDRALFPGPAAVEAGLVDGCRYPDEIEDLLLELAPGVGHRDEIPVVDGPAYLGLRAGFAGVDASTAWGSVPRVAVVVAEGAIHGGAGLRGVASDPYRETLERLRRDKGLAGVLLRIDSPGGDAVASDLLWRAARRVGEERPVVASLGDVAASGGYFLAAGASTILAEAATLTGSIGVVGGKVEASALLEKLGIHSEPTERGARAGLLSPERAFSPDERRELRAEMEELHRLFIDRVATGRELPADRIRALAGGRVWSGRQAVANGLADAIGGPVEALAALRERIGIAPEAPVALEMHPRLPRYAGLVRSLRPGAAVLV